MPNKSQKLVLVGLAGLFLTAGNAWAISRVETMGLSCEQVKAIVRQEGAAILRYPSRRNPDIVLYDRYVADRHSCLMGEITERKWVPTADQSCLVLRCYRPDPMDDRMIRPLR